MQQYATEAAAAVFVRVLVVLNTQFYPQKLALISPNSGGHSAGIVRSRAQATEFSFLSK
jgi:hypothetical protein